MSRAPAKKRPASMARPQVPVRVPLAPRTVWRWMLIGGGSLLGVGAIVWAVALGVPQRAVAEAAVMGSAAGFTVRQVEIQGTQQQPRLDIYQELLRGGTDSMFGLDVAAARARLISLPWVADARVGRRWPDRLRVEIYEKRPVAIWQLNGALQVVDAAGNPLPVGNLADFKELPLVIGVGANAQLADLQRLSARAPALFKALEAAHWVGDRRWDLKMKSGETVSLPQGPDATLAIEKLAAIDRATADNGVQVERGVQFVAAAFMITGVLSMAGATVQYRRELRRLQHIDDVYRNKPQLAAATAVLITLIGLVALVLITVRSNN